MADGTCGIKSVANIMQGSRRCQEMSISTTEICKSVRKTQSGVHHMQRSSPEAV